MRLRFLLLPVAAAVAACATVRERPFPVTKQGMIEAVALALRQPDKGYYSNRLELHMPAELVEPAKAKWTNFLGVQTPLDIMVLDVSADLSSGLTSATHFPPTPDGIAASEAFVHEKPTGQRIVMYKKDWKNDWKWNGWKWRDEALVGDTHATPDQVCDTRGCLDYADIRRAYFLADADAQSFDSPVGEFLDVTREGFPAQLAALKARGLPGQIRLEERDMIDDHRRIDLHIVSAVENDRICGVARPMQVRAVQCYSYAAIERVAVKDVGRSPGEVIEDTATLPFRVILSAAALFAIGTP